MTGIRSADFYNVLIPPHIIFLRNGPAFDDTRTSAYLAALETKKRLAERHMGTAKNEELFRLKKTFEDRL